MRAAPPPQIAARRAKAMTLVEVMVAVAVALAFLSGVMAAFIQISKSAERAEVEQDAVQRARAAVERMAIDIKQARMNPNFPIQLFNGINAVFPYGDGKDNDGDGAIDEERRNALDDDNDWTIGDDRHQFVAGTAERQDYLGAPDLGDARVDEDCRFDQDVLEFRIYPDPRVAGSRDEIVRYELGTFDGERGVLIRTLTRNPGAPDEETFREPLAFGVLSLDFLYFNPNVGPGAVPYWVESWDASTVFNQPDPRLPYPVAVFVSITVYADTRPFEHYKPGEAVDTLTLSTVVNIEQVLKDARWQRRR
ncbi:MAG: hypothetical protein Kow0059_16500 [Candidatus Sumerlaeia bacterium]